MKWDYNLVYGLNLKWYHQIVNLYKKHPDWCIHIPGRTRSEARRQLILDLSREEVCDYIIETVCEVLS